MGTLAHCLIVTLSSHYLLEIEIILGVLYLIESATFAPDCPEGEFPDHIVVVGGHQNGPSGTADTD